MNRSKNPENARTAARCVLRRPFYGYSDFTSELEQKITNGKIVLGGCCEELTDPKWQCITCGQSIHRVEVDEYGKYF